MDAMDKHKDMLLKIAVSIHAPVMDAMRDDVDIVALENVSIHAPVMDAMSSLTLDKVDYRQFQSTRP